MTRHMLLSAVALSLIFAGVVVAKPAPGRSGPPGTSGRDGFSGPKTSKMGMRDGIKKEGGHKSERLIGRLLRDSEFAEELGLSTSQVESIKEIHFEAKKNQIALRADVAQAKLEVHHLLGSAEPPQEQIMTAIEKSGQAQIALRKSDVGQLLQIRSLIGSDKWQQLRSQMHKRHRSRDVHRRPHGDGAMRHRQYRRGQMDEFENEGPLVDDQAFAG